MTCPRCNGSGEVVTPDGKQFQQCPLCWGSGEDPGRERAFYYLQQYVLSPNGILLNQRIVINGDAPFRVKTLTCTKSGDFRIRLYDSSGRYYSSSGEGGTNDRVRDACLFGTGALPGLVVPHIDIPAGGFLGFDLEDVSGATNTVHICYGGAKVYATVLSNASNGGRALQTQAA